MSAKGDGGIGHKMQDMNRALLAKLHWRLIIEKDSSEACLLSNKNNLNKFSDVEALTINSASYIWKSIAWNRALYQRGIYIVVRNGKSIFFWTDIWVNGFRLKAAALRAIP